MATITPEQVRQAIRDSLQAGRLVGEKRLSRLQRKQVQRLIALRASASRRAQLEAQFGLGAGEFGGQTLPTGEQVIVTPEGDIVASLERGIARLERQPTELERIRQQSLPADIRGVDPRQLQETAPAQLDQRQVVVDRTRPIFSREEVVDIGEIFRRGGEFIERRISQPILQRLPSGEVVQVDVPERRFLPSGTSTVEQLEEGVTIPVELEQPGLTRTVLGLPSPISAEQLGITFFLAPAFGPGAVARQRTVTKSFSEIAREQLSGLRSQFERARLGGQTGQLARTGFKNNVRKLLEGRSSQEINAFREFIRRTLGDDAARLVDDALAEQIVITPRPPARTITRPGQPAQLPPPLTLDVEGPGAEAVLRTRRSVFEGTGQFERTGEVGIPALRPRPLSDVFSVTPQIDFIGGRQPTSIRQQIGQLQEPTQGQFITPTISQLQRQIQQQTQTPGQGQFLRQQLGLASIQQQQQQQQQRQRQLQDVRLRFDLDTSPRLRPPRQRPGPGIIIPPQTPQALRTGLKKLSKQAKAFDVFVKKKGKFVKVADDLRFNRALKKGADVTRATLAATFKVVPDKKAKAPKRKDIKFTPDPKVFRNFEIKRGARVQLPVGTFIERRNKRITSGGEVREILGFQSRARKARGGTRSKRRSKLI